MSVIFEGVDMPTACTSVKTEQNPGGWLDASVKKCTFYNICKQRDTIKTNYMPDDCPVKPLKQEPQTFKWCTDCKEYDQEKHCCHRWSKVIRDTVEEMKQEYIEREVLDKIRDEIETKYGHCDICEYFEDYDFEENDISEYRPIGDIADILQIIDKYKAESEDK